MCYIFVTYKILFCLLNTENAGHSVTFCGDPKQSLQNDTLGCL